MKAEQQLDTARQSLADALLAPGADTDAARQAVRAAEARVADECARASRGAETAFLAREEQITAEAEAIASAADRAILDEVDNWLDFSLIQAHPTPRWGAATLVRARLERDARAALVADYLARERTISERQAALESRRVAIVAERADGRQDDAAQGRALALIAADLEGLAQLRDALGPPPQPPADEGERAWRHACAEARLTTLNAIAQTLQERLIQVAETIRQSEPPGSMSIGHRLRIDARLAIAAHQGVY